MPLIPLHGVAAALLLAAGAVWALPSENRVAAWVALGVLAVVVGTYAAFRQTSRLLGPCITRVGEAGNRVALTFDDGPGEEGTRVVLELLAARGVPATFFLIGKHAAARPAMVQAILAAGHQVGNHSYSHAPWLPFAPGPVLAADLSRCQAALAATGSAPTCYRPPYGIRNHATHSAARRAGVTVIGWDCGGLDTTGRSVEALLHRIRRQLRPGSIILLHDHVPNVERVAALVEGVLDELERRQLQPVLLDELLASGEPRPNSRVS